MHTYQIPRTWLLCILSCLLGTFAFAQPKESTITGKWVNPQRAPKELKLLSIHNGTLHELASSTLQEGNFQLRFHPEREGFYAIAPNAQARPYYHLFYFKPGDNLSVEFENGAFRLTGSDNTSENQVLEQWHKLLWPLESKSTYYYLNEQVGYQEFFSLLEQMLPEIQAFPQARTGNAAFNASFEQFKKISLTDVAVAFIFTPQQVHPQSKDYPDFYRNIDLRELTATTDILNHPNGLDFLQRCHWTGIYANPDIPVEEIGLHTNNIQEQFFTKDLIANDTVKGEIVLDGATLIKTYPGIELYRRTYGQWLVTDDQKQRFEQLASQYEANPKPVEATDFRFEDTEGNQVALSDFKGKVVYVDVWATWCAPCKMQIPHMVELEKQYHGNPDIVFMSVSVDARKDYDKWKAMLKEKHMSGVQLFAGERKSDIMTPYQIKGIPRFMIFDRDGKAIYTNAPRPSSMEIKAVLDSVLKK